MKAFIIIIVVVAALVGGILTLRSTRDAGMPGKDVLERAKLRARDQDSKDDQEAER